MGNKEVTDNHQIARYFKQYFTSENTITGSKNEVQIPEVEKEDTISIEPIDGIFSQDFSEEVLKETIRNRKMNKTTGPDKILP